MRRSLALLIPAVLLAGACTQSPTDAAREPTAVRLDGGNYHGSGNVVSEGVNTTGSGNAVGSGPSGGGSITTTTTNTAPADSTGATGRGGNYFGSGN